MSGILGIFSWQEPLPEDAAVQRMLGAMSRRGGDASTIWRDAGCVLGVGRYDWELEPGFSGPGLLVREGDLVVAADATLYYREDLERKLRARGVRPGGDTPSHLILAAYRAWGEDCAQHLEGDFAFALWDAAEQKGMAVREFGVKRPLYYAELGGTLVVASTISAILEHPRCPHELNLVAIAEYAAALWAPSPETCYRAIRTLDHGWKLSWQHGRKRLEPYWTPLPIGTGKRAPAQEAAEELRELLTRAVAERLAPAGPTATQLSGGWDSPSVFAAGMRYLRARAEDDRLRPVSVSYPEGDPGREDELIQAMVDHWSRPVHWLDIRDIPLLEGAEQRAARRDEPFAHAFELWNRTLMRAAREEGARVMLDGVGGDQLFQVSNVYFADLLRRGKLRTLAREWRAKRAGGWKDFFQFALRPLLPEWVTRVPELFGAQPWLLYLDRWPAEWMNRDFVRKHGLIERERRYTPARQVGSHANHETYWYLLHPFFPHVFSCVAGFGLEEGVESRSPLFDRRIIEFAVTRPRWERSTGKETKWLLRSAVYGLLPDWVLAPRPYKTGLTSGYFQRSLQEAHRELITRTFRSPLWLEDLGMVDATVLRRQWDLYLHLGEGALGSALFSALQAELWLRGRLGPVPGLAPSSVTPRRLA